MGEKHFLVEVETSTLKTYEVRHMTEAEIKRRVSELEDQLDPVEEHRQVKVKSLIAIED